MALLKEAVPRKAHTRQLRFQPMSILVSLPLSL